jgi:hypothetical protein
MNNIQHFYRHCGRVTRDEVQAGGQQNGTVNLGECYVIAFRISRPLSSLPSALRSVRPKLTRANS